MLTALVNALFQFAVNLNDPNQTCQVIHRDPGVTGTYFLYCAQMQDDVEFVTVGKFVADVKVKP